MIEEGSYVEKGGPVMIFKYLLCILGKLPLLPHPKGG